LVAEARGLQTNATMAATSSGAAKRLSSEDGLAFSKNSFSPGRAVLRAGGGGSQQPIKEGRVFSVYALLWFRKLGGLT